MNAAEYKHLVLGLIFVKLSDDTLKKITHELTDNLRLMVKRILRKYKYPPDATDSAVEWVLEQAAFLDDEWAG